MDNVIYTLYIYLFFIYFQQENFKIKKINTTFKYLYQINIEVFKLK